MIRALRPLFAVATIALILLGAYYLIEKDRVRREQEQVQQAAIVPIDASRATRQDMRKRMREASRLAAEEGCIRLREDFGVWEAYFDKKTRRKLKALIASCDTTNGNHVSAEP